MRPHAVGAPLHAPSRLFVDWTAAIVASGHCPANVVVWPGLRKGIFYYAKRQSGMPRLTEDRLPGGLSHQRLTPLVAWLGIVCPNRVGA